MENQNRDFKGIWIPKDIYLSKELNWTDKILLIEINSLDNENHCTASNAYFAEFIGTSERSISRSINKLIQLGYVKMINFNGRQRALTTLSVESRQECLCSVDTDVYQLNNSLNKLNIKEEKEIYKEKFEEWWSYYPKLRAGSKKKAYQKFKQAIAEEKLTPEFLIEKVKEYANSEEVNKGYACGAEVYFSKCKYNNQYNTAEGSDWDYLEQSLKGRE